MIGTSTLAFNADIPRVWHPRRHDPRQRCYARRTARDAQQQRRDGLSTSMSLASTDAVFLLARRRASSGADPMRRTTRSRTQRGGARRTADAVTSVAQRGAFEPQQRPGERGPAAAARAPSCAMAFFADQQASSTRQARLCFEYSSVPEYWGRRLEHLRPTRTAARPPARRR